MGFSLSIRRFTFSKVNNGIFISNLIAFADQLHDLISLFSSTYNSYNGQLCFTIDSKYHLKYFHDIIVLIILLTSSANNISADQNIDRQLGSKFRLVLFFVWSFLYHWDKTTCLGFQTRRWYDFFRDIFT